MRESPIQAEVMLAVGALPGVRTFRNSVGGAWMGAVVERAPGTVLLAHPRHVTFGWGTGSADLLGWRSVLVTPEMIGQRIAQIVALEVKAARGRSSADQTHFLDVVRGAGGLADVVRSGADAARLVQGGLA